MKAVQDTRCRKRCKSGDVSAGVSLPKLVLKIVHGYTIFKHSPYAD
ncbi:MAG TPA: hypothetical protein DHV15_06730 [Treponema sp.]|uniref:Uncharacterized protein n=1 Tax=Treponema denticola (strain ATCC 35405 / DSM 14222 / CIP 103919 / JCM 8153 / KCTC 15104) TaxID=243275 RepID=Q73PQ7_TREDE|nr:hypothetical protein TDE_0740 [Treponema denticola ATCC 35405]HCY95197.1 hypothetical protein [Treponema sp.]